MTVIEAHDIAKTYPAHGGKRALLGRGGIGRLFRPRIAPRQALAPLSLRIGRGEAVGIIGRNGSGKSTLLKIIAGVTAPTAGTLKVHGRVASLLELGAGFHPMLTGRENVYLYAGLLGMRHAQVDACFDAIVEFAELENSIDSTVDTYSSGMYIRLAFAVAIHTDPDVFLVDEVLAVGDESFQRKCRARIVELKAAGKTILFVSHDLGTVQSLCDHVLLLDDGCVISRGDTQGTIDYYLRQIGHAGGIRRIVCEDTEAVFNHGRISLFHRNREVTAPLGVKVQFFTMETYHESTEATWTVTDDAESGIKATGTFHRLPIRLYLACTLTADGLSIDVTWETAQPLDLSYVAVQCFLPLSYTRWYAGDDSGEFPSIAQEDRRWTAVARCESDDANCILCGEDETETPAVGFTVTKNQSGACFQIDNTNFMDQSRVVHLTETMSGGRRTLSPGQQRVGRVHINPMLTNADVAARYDALQTSQVLSAGGLGAEMKNGFVELNSGGHPLTHFMHLHVQLHVGDLWIMSHDLDWSPVERTRNCQLATGRSQRFPCSLTWSLEEDGQNAFRLQVSLETREELEIREYNVSVCLGADYTCWETKDESGNFGAPGNPDSGWSHLNSAYAEGHEIVAQADVGPPVTLKAERMLGTTIPTAIRTDADQDSRVLQLLSSPGQQGTFTLTTGTHVLFLGRLSTTPETTP
jgi:ABC-type polysaccharide/polyol phosphate transport system ATPase subunit